MNKSEWHESIWQMPLWILVVKRGMNPEERTFRMFCVTIKKRRRKLHQPMNEWIASDVLSGYHQISLWGEKSKHSFQYFIWYTEIDTMITSSDASHEVQNLNFSYICFAMITMSTRIRKIGGKEAEVHDDDLRVLSRVNCASSNSNSSNGRGEKGKS